MELVGIDLGGSHCSCVVLDATGTVLRRGNVSIVTHSRANVEQVLSAVVAACDRAGVRPADSRGLGIGVPGNVDPTRGVTRYLANFGWTQEVPSACNTIRFFPAPTVYAT